MLLNLSSHRSNLAKPGQSWIGDASWAFSRTILNFGPITWQKSKSNVQWHKLGISKSQTLSKPIFQAPQKDDLSTITKDKVNQLTTNTSSPWPSTWKHTQVHNFCVYFCTLFTSYNQHTKTISPPQLMEIATELSNLDNWAHWTNANTNFLDIVYWGMWLHLMEDMLAQHYECIFQRLPWRGTFLHPWHLIFWRQERLGWLQYPCPRPTILPHCTYHFLCHHQGSQNFPWRIHWQP